jgi:MFS superfamily sulfate permease-like transporter
MKFFKSVLLPTIVGYVEMQAVSRINALQTGHTVNGNREFFAIGMANLVNSFFGGFVAFAATTRSKTLLLNGSKTTMVNFISGILASVVVYSIGRGLQYVPRPVLAAIVMKSAIVLFSTRDLRFLFKIHAWEDLTMFLVSFVITFCTSIFEGIIFCLIVAVLVIIKKVSFVNLSILGRYRDTTPGGSAGQSYVDINENPKAEIDDGIMIVSVKGPFLFYNSTSFSYTLRQLMKEDRRLQNELAKDLTIVSSSQTMNMVGVDEHHDYSDSNLTTRSQRLLERIVAEVRRLENAASDINNHPYILIIDFSRCLDIDTTALQTLLHVVRSEQAYETR